jgi:diguanylate cyclase (GGDEF)-like protein
MVNTEKPNNYRISIHFADLAPIACSILSVGSSEITLKLENQQQHQSLSVGLPATLTVEPLNSLSISATILSQALPQLIIATTPNQQDRLGQLQDWLKNEQQTASGNPSTTTNKPLIDELTQTAIKHISDLFQVFLKEADNRLFNMAEIAVSNEEQNNLFATKTILRKQGDQLLKDYCNNLESRIAQITNGSTAEIGSIENPQQDMELIDLEEFEDWLSQDVIIKRANQHHYKSLTCLERRYSKLLDCQVSGNQLPVSIENLAQALQHTLKQQDINPSLLPIIYRLFDDTVIYRLDNVFDILNSKLKSHGILPNIESQLMNERRQIIKSQPAISVPTTEQAVVSENAAMSQHSTASPALFETAKNLFKLTKTPQASSNGNLTAATKAATANQVIDLLNTLQQDQKLSAELADQSSLAGWLQQNAAEVSAEHLDLITLVDTIFKTINQYPHIPPSMASTLKRLELPVAKAALMDNSFFATPDHPVTQLLNQMVNLCIKADMPNQTLEKKLASVIGNIADNFQQDLSVFDHATEELQLTETQQKTAYQRNTDRVAQTCNGRQQVQQARNAVDRELNRRISAPEAPEVVIELIENGWRELLNLNYIKQGPNSESWYENIATLDQLQLWLSGDEGDAQSTIEREMEADTFADLIAQKLNNIFPADYHYQDSVEKIRSVLKGHQPVKMTKLDKDPYHAEQNFSELQKELEAANPHLSRWFKQAKNLKPGDEFTYLDDPGGERNIKLAWVSDNHQHYVFVNNRGQKVLDFDLVDVANELSSGMSPLEQSTEWPLVEHSLYSTVQQAYEKLAFKSTHDELTGLISRKECERVLNNTLLDAKNALQIHSLLYLDIDHFSITNDLHGHIAGDQMLVEVSNMLTKATPKGTIIARMAGNEFVVLLKNCGAAKSLQEAKSLGRTIERHTFMWQQHEIQLTASTGLIVINKYTENVVDLIRNALSACQQAKQNGGNRVQEFRQDEELHRRREKLLTWIDQLSHVMSSGQLVLRGQRIQPISEAAGEPHFEILLAIKDDQGNLSSPIEFIEAAECYNRMQRVDRWVIEHTFQWLSQLQRDGISIPNASINLSGNSINDDQFVDYILEQFATYNIPTRNICFEVTETATINNLSEAADFIRNIKKVGCTFSLDDFGSGNASYQYLKHLPVDYLKIDGMFVKDIDKNPDDYALVKSINDIAHLMGKKTIAEYAETKEIIAILKEINVDYVQGYAIDMPTPLSEILLDTPPPIAQAQ